MKAIGGHVRRISSCEGKERFISFGRAARTAHRQAQHRKGKFTAYPCHFCSGFHVGTQLGSDPHGTGTDRRQNYAVFAREGGGAEQLVGWSNDPSGGKVAELILEEPGWTLSRVTERRRRAA